MDRVNNSRRKEEKIDEVDILDLGRGSEAGREGGKFHLFQNKLFQNKLIR